MKSADEIKRGLELCTLSYVKCVSKRPYAGDDCVERLVTDAIDLIQIHEESIEKKNNGLFELVLIIKQLEAERAELLDLCEQFGQCVICEHTDKGTNESPCCDCWYCNGDATGSRWQWRGVQKEE